MSATTRGGTAPDVFPTDGSASATDELRINGWSLQDFDVCGVLGQGAFGRVMVAVAKDTQQESVHIMSAPATHLVDVKSSARRCLP